MVYCVWVENAVRILLAEDERITQLYLTHLLTAAGHSVTVAGDGAAAMDLLRDHPFDLIFMDVQMPVVGGIEASRRIRAGEVGPDRTATPIVVLTAYTDDPGDARYDGADIQRVLTKPLDGRALLAVVEEFAACRQGSE